MSALEALDRALGMEADRPGVTHLCQELLSELTGKLIPPAPSVEFERRRRSRYFNTGRGHWWGTELPR